jgi:hypothetical protein
MTTETKSTLPTDENTFLESEVRRFIGWLSGDIPELHKVEVPRLADSWERFKERISQDDNDEPDEPLEPYGECYRGGEAAGALAEEQARIQRELK